MVIIIIDVDVLVIVYAKPEANFFLFFRNF